jgi:hypothetical protein
VEREREDAKRERERESAMGKKHVMRGAVGIRVCTLDLKWAFLFSAVGSGPSKITF